MAMGSRRTTPTWPVIAAVVSVLIAEPRKTPWAQSNASNTSGMTLVRREPKMKAEIGTPCGSSQFGAIDGHCCASTVKREFGCAAGVPGVHGQIGLARRARHGRGDIRDLALRVLDADDQHVLREPAFLACLPRSQAQGVALLAEQRVAAVAGADAPDQLFLGEVQDQAALR